jgi:hypothetical protein
MYTCVLPLYVELIMWCSIKQNFWSDYSSNRPSFLSTGSVQTHSLCLSCLLPCILEDCFLTLSKLSLWGTSSMMFSWSLSTKWQQSQPIHPEQHSLLLLVFLQTNGSPGFLQPFCSFSPRLHLPYNFLYIFSCSLVTKPHSPPGPPLTFLRP